MVGSSEIMAETIDETGGGGGSSGSSGGRGRGEDNRLDREADVGGRDGGGGGTIRHDLLLLP